MGMAHAITWDPDACQTGLTIADDGATLRWIIPPLGHPPMWLGAQARGMLAKGRFRWEVEVTTAGRQLGIGILLDPPDWGFFGYLGAGHNAWAYDPHEGAIVTETRAIHAGLPCVIDRGRIAIELDLLREHTCTFVVNGQRTPPIALPPGCLVIPAACLLKVGQEVRSLSLEVLEQGAVANAAAADARFEEQRELNKPRDRVPDLRAEADRLRAACGQQPHDVDLWLKLSDVLSELGASDEIRAEQLQIYWRVTQMEPRNWEALRWYAFYLGCFKKDEEQLECWDRLLAGLPQSDPYGPQAPRRRSEPARQSLGRKLGAEGYYLVEKVQCLARLGRQSEMLALMDRVLTMPLDSYARKDMADLLVGVGAYEQALKLYLQAVEQNPNFTHAFMQIGKCLIRMGRADSAVQALRRAFNQNMVGARELAAWVLFQSGKEAEAEQVLREHFAVHRHFYPLSEDRKTVGGFEVDDRYRAWVAEMAKRYGP
jgi:tetratricopeptide (TPR) repeat protein